MARGEFMNSGNDLAVTHDGYMSPVGWQQYTANSDKIFQQFMQQALSQGMDPNTASMWAQQQYNQWGQAQSIANESPVDSAPFGIKELAPFSGIGAPLGVLGLGSAAATLGGAFAGSADIGAAGEASAGLTNLPLAPAPTSTLMETPLAAGEGVSGVGGTFGSGVGQIPGAIDFSNVDWTNPSLWSDSSAPITSTPLSPTPSYVDSLPGPEVAQTPLQQAAQQAVANGTAYSGALPEIGYGAAGGAAGGAVGSTLSNMLPNAQQVTAGVGTAGVANQVANGGGMTDGPMAPAPAPSTPQNIQIGGGDGGGFDPNTFDPNSLGGGPQLEVPTGISTGNTTSTAPAPGNPSTPGQINTNADPMGQFGDPTQTNFGNPTSGGFNFSDPSTWAGGLQDLFKNANIPGMVGSGLEFAGNQQATSRLLDLMQQGMNKADPFADQRAQYQNMYKQYNTDPNFLNNDAVLQGIQNNALRNVASNDATRGYLGSGNILQDLTRTGTETAANYGLARGNQLAQAAGANANPGAAGQIVAGMAPSVANMTQQGYGALGALAQYGMGKQSPQQQPININVSRIV